jgi:5-methylcytosine-specific restriction protein B
MKHYVENPIVGDDERGSKFWDKLPHQLALCPAESIALFAEIYWVLTLPSSSLKPNTKLDRIEAIWRMAGSALPAFDADSPYLKFAALQGVGSTGTAYNLLMWMELAYAIRLFKTLAEMQFEERKLLLENPWNFAVWIDGIDETGGRQLYHILAHALFPDFFERVFAEGGKMKLARSPLLAIPKSVRSNRPERDKALLAAREQLEKTHPDVEIDYYSFPPILVPGKPARAVARRAGVSLADGFEVPAAGENADGADLVGEDAASNPGSKVWIPRNLIFFGPPGSGKTHAMEDIRAERYSQGEYVEFVSFHPSYSYEDFVEGYRPAPGQGGRLSEKPIPGPFRRFCESAHRHPDVRHTLFIDEINRANVAKVFGELITLIEPSKRCTPAPDLDFSDVRSAVRLQYSGEAFAVPANLDIVATMNTADRSVQSMDRALRRRFEFIETPADPEALSATPVEGVDLRRLLQTINDRVELLIDRDHAIGHAMLIDVRCLQDLRHAISRRIIPLLQEYFFEDLDKAKLVLTGSSRTSVFFDERTLDPGELFEDANALIGDGVRRSLRPASDPAAWTSADFIRLYLRGADADAVLAALAAEARYDADEVGRA